MPWMVDAFRRTRTEGCATDCMSVAILVGALLWSGGVRSGLWSTVRNVGDTGEAKRRRREENILFDSIVYVGIHLKLKLLQSRTDIKLDRVGRMLFEMQNHDQDGLEQEVRYGPSPTRILLSLINAPAEQRVSANLRRMN